jgi:hypothetical protein
MMYSCDLQESPGRHWPLPYLLYVQSIFHYATLLCETSDWQNHQVAPSLNPSFPWLRCAICSDDIVSLSQPNWCVACHADEFGGVDVRLLCLMYAEYPDM